MRQPNDTARPAEPIASLLDQLLDEFEHNRPQRPTFMLAPRLRAAATELPRRVAT